MYKKNGNVLYTHTYSKLRNVSTGARTHLLLGVFAGAVRARACVRGQATTRLFQFFRARKSGLFVAEIQLQTCVARLPEFASAYPGHQIESWGGGLMPELERIFQVFALRFSGISIAVAKEPVWTFAFFLKDVSVFKFYVLKLFFFLLSSGAEKKLLSMSANRFSSSNVGFPLLLLKAYLEWWEWSHGLSPTFALRPLPQVVWQLESNQYVLGHFLQARQQPAGSQMSKQCKITDNNIF